VLNYDLRLPGFVIDLDRSKLEKAPSFTAAAMRNWSDRTYGNRIDQFLWHDDLLCRLKATPRISWTPGEDVLTTILR
jgi:hypothetical protein